ncbi:MAG TPA: hypothetical protein VFV23_01510 [Verrucomicrobiae bacterium]|nr:hypothetical protein [Verrucomicrobiae bacterium]
MTRDEAKTILLLYRTPADADDPQIAEALAFAKSDSGLSQWFAEHCARQEMLRRAFREIAVPAGLKEKILAAQEKTARKKNSWAEADWRILFRPIPLTAMAAAVIIGLLIFGGIQYQHRANEWREHHSLANFQNSMVGMAENGYAMELQTNDLKQIQNYFARNDAPADYTLPPNLENATVTGCAVKDWNGAKVSVICFRTGKPLLPGQQNDLWLFVMDESAAKTFSASASPQFQKVDRLATAFWSRAGKIYFLGTSYDDGSIRDWL